ncbi:hypothetical protein [Actinocorallia longicatena]|uniref:Uncharacterized protein n=1 Tax=Actinocorallia longicatena TaxID=111803 RepID=A0ABP6QMJ2_9ACTN
MTSTARWVMAQRRKRLIISQTLRDRAQTDPRRTGFTVPEPADAE